MSKVVTKVVGVAKTVRNHWKKSILFCGLASYGVKYSKELYKDETLRREYCLEAVKYGDHSIKLHQRPRKVTVFLNPAVSRGKGVKLFEKNAAPILHLAGIQVDVVKTEFEGQVKQLLTVLEKDHTDAIIVAGGDGTLLETVTGVMRKKNREFCQSIPIGLIPLGRQNRFAKMMFGEDSNQVKFIMDAAMAIVKAIVKPVDVMEIKTDDGKDTYAMSGLQFGVYNDSEVRKTKYWYFGPLKSYWTYLRTAMKKWPPDVTLKVEYVPASATLATKKVLAAGQEKQEKKWSLIQFLYKPKTPSQAYLEEYEIEDKDWVHKEISTVELTVMSSNYETANTDTKTLNLGIGPSSISKTELIEEGWSRIGSKDLKFGTEKNEYLKAHKLKLIPEIKEGEELWYNVDGEAFESRPIEMTMLKNRLQMFYQPIQSNVGM